MATELHAALDHQLNGKPIILQTLLADHLNAG